MPVMVDPRTGEVYENVPDADVGKAQAEFGLISPEEYAYQQKYGDFRNQAEAAGKVAANVATLGIAGFDSAEDKAQIRVFRDKSPSLAALTETAAAIAPAAVGGVGAAGALGRLGASARAAQIGGLVTEEVLQSYAVEQEQALEQERDIEVGNVIMGLPLAMGISAAGRLARGATRGTKAFAGGLRAGLADNVAEAADASSNMLAQGRRTSQARRSVGAASAAGDTRVPLTETEVRQYAQGRDEIHNQVERFGGDAIEDGVAGMNPAFDELSNIGLKRSDVAGKMADADVESMLDFADTNIAAIDDLATKLEAQGQTKAAKTLRAHVNEMAEAYTLVDQAPEELAIAGDRAKRAMQKLRGKYSRIKDVTAENIVGQLDEVSEPMRLALEDGNTWGKLWSEKQLGENRLWAGDEGLIRSGAIWQKEFIEQLPGPAGRKWTDTSEVPVFKVRGDIVQHALAMKKRDFELAMNAWSKWIDNAEEMALLKTELGVDSAQVAPRLQQSLSDMRTTIDELKTIREVDHRGAGVIKKEAAKAEAQGLGEMAFDVAENIPGVRLVDTAAEKLTGKSLRDRLFQPKIKDALKEYTREEAGAIIRERRGGLGKPSRPKPPSGPQGGPPVAPPAAPTPMGGVDRVSLVGRSFADSARGETATTDALSEISQNNRAIQERAALGLIAKDSRPPKLPPLAERFKEGAPSIQAAFKNKVDDLQRAAEDPQAFVDGMTDTFGRLADGGHASLYEQVIVRTQVGAQYLLANMPPSVGISMARPDGIPPDSLAIMKWAAMYNAVFSPGDVVYDVGTGDATPTQIRALREVHTDIYANLRIEVLKQVGQAGANIPFETLRSLDNLFDVPGVAGPAFGPGMSATMAQAYAAPAAKNPRQSLGGESVIAPPSATSKFSRGPSNIAA